MVVRQIVEIHWSSQLGLACVMSPLSHSLTLNSPVIVAHK